MEKLVSKLRQDYPDLLFKEAAIASWSPRHNTISYKLSQDIKDRWSVLHELGHALLGHNSYISDLDLLQKELEAWNQAKVIANKYSVTIDDGHIQDCMDTYRDWLHKRSSCPYCQKHGFQQSKGLYSCLNCFGTWMVSSERFCRPYRLKKA